MGDRMDYTWNGLSTGTSAVALAGGAPAISSVVITGGPGTLIRSRGEILASIDGPTDGDKIGIGFGLIRGTEEQVAVGASAVPSPLDDLDADWVWHGFILLQSQAVVATSAGQQFGRLTVDSKAMRKFRQGEVLILAIDSINMAGTPAIDVAFGFRILFGE